MSPKSFSAKSAHPQAIRLTTERRLVTHYLRIDGGAVSGPLRFIDATMEELKEALACQGDPITALAAACGNSTEAEQLFAHGTLEKWPDQDSPGYFRYLVLTCAITAIAVTNKDTRNFRVNLAAAFGRRDPFNNLSALPELWERLRHWCARQRKAGKPLRALILPESPSYRFVGYSQEMTFPAWRDVIRLRTLTSKEIDLQNDSDPERTALRMARIVHSSGAFAGAMQRVATEYLRYYQAGAALLATHPFRAAALVVQQSQRPRKTAPQPSLRIELRIQLDIEDAELTVKLIQLAARDDDALDPSDALMGSPESVMPKMTTWANHHLLDPRLPLLSVLRTGVIPMFEERFGLWIARDRPPEFPARCRLLWKDGADGPIRKLKLRSYRLGQQWRLTDILLPTDVRYVFEALSLGRTSWPRSADLLRIEGGFETSAGYLGRASLLPRVWAPSKGKLSLSSASAEEESILLLDSIGGYHVAETATPLDGLYRLRVQEQMEGAIPLSQEKIVSFVADAPEHLEYNEPNPERWETVRETTATPMRRFTGISPRMWTAVEPRVRRDRRFDDLLEGIYARGKSGWSEFELVATMQGVLGPDAPSPWDLLRSLEEGGWLRSVYAIAWGVRRWLLVRPHLLSSSPEGDQVTLCGSTTAAIRARFAGITQRLGGVPSEHDGVGPYSPPIVAAQGVAAEAIAEQTKWPISTQVVGDSVPAAPVCWPIDGCDPASHELVATWSWDDGRFTKTASGTREGVGIERYRRERGDRRDVFRVFGGEPHDWIGWSRVVAITEAYRRAGRNFLAQEGELLVRVPTDGYLPLALASRLGFEALCRGGPVAGADGWRYAYPRGESGETAIRRVFGHRFVFDGTEPLSDAPDRPLTQLGTARHRPHLRAGAVLRQLTQNRSSRIPEGRKG